MLVFFLMKLGIGPWPGYIVDISHYRVWLDWLDNGTFAEQRKVVNPK